MVHRGIKVGVVTNLCRHRVFDFGLGHQTALQLRLLGRANAQAVRQRAPQRAPVARPQRHQRIQPRLGAGMHRQFGFCHQNAGASQRRQVDNLVANGHTAATGFDRIAAPEHRERQVLDRKIAARLVRRSEPAAQRRIVGFVQ